MFSYRLQGSNRIRQLSYKHCTTIVCMKYFFNHDERIRGILLRIRYRRTRWNCTIMQKEIHKVITIMKELVHVLALRLNQL